MKRRPNYWQLDLFVCGMIALGIILLQAHIVHQWERLTDTGWAVIAIAGMSIWVWANWLALCEEDRRQRHGLRPSERNQNQVEAPPRPLTPVQRHFLESMRRSSRR